MPELSETELESLALQVDEQLLALQATFGLESTRGAAAGAGDLPAAPDQQALLEQVTGQPFPTFWQRYLENARRDLCLPGGMLHEQWQRYRDLESKSVVKFTFGVLVGMGVPTAGLSTAAVAAAVFLINTALKIGVDTICEGCAAGSNPTGAAAGEGATA